MLNLKWKIKRRLVEKLRIVYKNSYIHEMWVYNLKISKDGNYTWTHYNQGNRIIDLQPEEISSIFVVAQKKVFYKSRIRKRKPKANIVLDFFKPRTGMSFSELRHVPTNKLHSVVKLKDDVQITLKKVEQETSSKTGFGY